MPNKDPEKRKAYDKAWYSSHKDEMKAYFKAYYRAHKRTSMQGRGVRTDLGYDADLMSFEEIGRRLGYASHRTPVYLYHRAMAKLRKRLTHGQILEMLQELAADRDGGHVTDSRVRASLEGARSFTPISKRRLLVSPSSRRANWEKRLGAIDRQE